MELPRLTHSYDTFWSPEEWQELGAIISSCPLPSTQKSCPGNTMMVQDHGEREEEALATYSSHTGGEKDVSEIVSGQLSLKGHYCNEEK